MEKKRPESALIVVHTPQGSVLLMERMDWPGFWQSVTGSLEKNETPRQAALRELQEETGLIPEMGRLHDCQQVNKYQIFEQFLPRYAEGQRTNQEHVFCFEVPNQCAIVLTEHVQYEWLPKNEALQRAFTDTDKRAIGQWVKEVE